MYSIDYPNTRLRGLTYSLADSNDALYGALYEPSAGVIKTVLFIVNIPNALSQAGKKSYSLTTNCAGGLADPTCTANLPFPRTTAATTNYMYSCNTPLTANNEITIFRGERAGANQISYNINFGTTSDCVRMYA